MRVGRLSVSLDGDGRATPALARNPHRRGLPPASPAGRTARNVCRAEYWRRKDDLFNRLNATTRQVAGAWG